MFLDPTIIPNPVRTECWYATSHDAHGQRWRWMPWGDQALTVPADDPILAPRAYHPTKESLQAWCDRVVAGKKFMEPMDVYGLELHHHAA